MWEVFHSLIYSQNAWNRQGWAMVKPRPRNSVLVEWRVAGTQVLEPPVAFPEFALTEYWMESRTGTWTSYCKWDAGIWSSTLTAAPNVRSSFSLINITTWSFMSTNFVMNNWLAHTFYRWFYFYYWINSFCLVIFCLISFGQGSYESKILVSLYLSVYLQYI